MSKDVYPENCISLVVAKTESGKPATGWVDLAYRDYRFKKYCPFHLQFSVEIKDDANNDELDFAALEDYFVNELKQGCVAHPVARVATDFGFIMDVYVDDAEIASKRLAELYEDPTKPADFGCGFNRDPNWKQYRRITNLVNS